MTTEALGSGCDGVVLTCVDDAESVLTMIEMAERLHGETEAVIAVRATSRYTDQLVAALVSARADLVDVV